MSEPDVIQYLVQKGDTLSSVAKNQLGSATKWREILALNPEITGQSDALPEGSTIRLPRVASPPR